MVRFHVKVLCFDINDDSCIYAHSCLKPLSNERKPSSNNQIHVQIMKFACYLNMVLKTGLCLFAQRYATKRTLRRGISILAMLFLTSALIAEMKYLTLDFAS